VKTLTDTITSNLNTVATLLLHTQHHQSAALTFILLKTAALVI